MGYYTKFGFMGFINGEKMLFASEEEFHEYEREIETRIGIGRKET